MLISLIFAKLFYFTGVSIWIFFILSNANFLVTLNTECNFTLDGQVVGNFYHLPNQSTSALQYNALAFSASGLNNSQHDLVISTNDLPYAVYINFDYAVYTYVYSVAPCIHFCGSNIILGSMTLPLPLPAVSLGPVTPQNPHKPIIRCPTASWG